VANWQAPARSDAIANTAQYNVELTTDDGICETRVIQAGHLYAQFDNIPPASAVTVNVVGLRDDQGTGTGETVQLAAETKVPQVGAP